MSNSSMKKDIQLAHQETNQTWSLITFIALPWWLVSMYMSDFALVVFFLTIISKSCLGLLVYCGCFDWSIQLCCDLKCFPSSGVLGFTSCTFNGNLVLSWHSNCSSPHYDLRVCLSNGWNWLLPDCKSLLTFFCLKFISLAIRFP